MHIAYNYSDANVRSLDPIIQHSSSLYFIAVTGNIDDDLQHYLILSFLYARQHYACLGDCLLASIALDC